MQKQAQKHSRAFGVNNPVLFGLRSSQKVLFRQSVPDLEDVIPYEEWLVGQAVRKAQERLTLLAIEHNRAHTQQVVDRSADAGKRTGNSRSAKPESRSRSHAPVHENEKVPKSSPAKQTDGETELFGFDIACDIVEREGSMEV